jgi:hypothetical protein
VYWGIALSLGIATSIATSAVSSLLVGPRGHFVVAVTVALLFVSPYAILVRIQCQRLQRASERLRFGEEIERQAREQSAVGLWVLAIGSLLSVAMGLVIVFVEPAEWIAGLVFLVGGGLSALVFARMLLVRWRTRASRS